MQENILNEVRPEFSFLFTSQSPNIAVVACRGGGKTHAAVQSTLYKLLNGRPNSFASFFSATLLQAKATVEGAMRLILRNFPEGKYQYNVSEHKYKFFIDSTDIREFILLSYENQETKRGYHPDIIVLDECGSMPHNMLGLVIEPMLGPAMSRGMGRLLAIGTARGPNKFYELFQRGQSEQFSDWESYMIKSSDTRLLDSEYLWRMRNSLSPAEYAQEFECDFHANALVGSVFGQYLIRYARNNISDIYDYDPSFPVWTSWDLGHSNNTAIWFFQIKGDCITFIDYYENRGYDITHFANEVLSKPYNIRMAILPWDAGARNVRSPLTIAEMLENYGLRSEVLENSSVKAGIDAARLLLKTARFNRTKCKLGLDHLEKYRFHVDYQTGVDRQKPVHDEHSDGADAFRYAAVWHKAYSPKMGSGKVVLGQDYSVF
jgi:hypothetical protein